MFALAALTLVLVPFLEVLAFVAARRVVPTEVVLAVIGSASIAGAIILAVRWPTRLVAGAQAETLPELASPMARSIIGFLLLVPGLVTTALGLFTAIPPVTRQAERLIALVARRRARRQSAGPLTSSTEGP